jgi:hypothetical protein
MANRKKREQALPLSVKNILRGTPDPFTAVSGFRETLSKKHYPGLSKWLAVFGTRAAAFWAGRKPRAIPFLRSEKRILAAIPPDDELFWAGCWISQHPELLCNFAKAQASFSTALLTQDYGSCLRQLDETDRRFGISQWSIDARLALLQLGEGLEAQKHYLSGFRAQVRSGAVEFVTYFISQRNEGATNPLSFSEKMVEALPQLTSNEEFQVYTLFKIVGLWNGEPEAAGTILRWEFSTPIVDYYDTFIRLASQSIRDSTPQS